MVEIGVVEVVVDRGKLSVRQICQFSEEVAVGVGEARCATL